ncbi:Murein hydrolase activator NlpD precursor [Corynebacterium occultum]|uniref:Murein hydrolase activator NlpD n=1 Tax=Corynebacterium occultum TaxID=2675219 RepID=A0A6B8W000_9CORY|nr:M23 family metallopeptidase [Corynebacterium occultum]QGU08569.1 Murein hydrolase activator NlpD precursor [Corynebacterium occultum]
MNFESAAAQQSTTTKRTIGRRVGVAAVVGVMASTTGVSAANAQTLDYNTVQTAVDQYAPQAAAMVNDYVATGSSASVLQNLPVSDYGTGFGVIEEIAAPSVVKPAQGTFTSGFGPRWGSMHNGIDIANAIGTPIQAVMAGTVIDSGPASGYGQWIRIRHEDGSISVYGHMSSLYVGVGQWVSAGQTIAGMGSEGFSTGSHLHFEIWPNGVTPVDPQAWLAGHGIYL